MSQTAAPLSRPTGRCATRKPRSDTNEIERLLAFTERPDIISFAIGLPADETFPMAAVRAAAAEALDEAGPSGLQYCPTPGITALRETLARHMRSLTGGSFSVANVLVTTGAQQALDLVGRELLSPGDRLGIQSPTYFGALAAWKPHGLRFQRVGIDEEGAIGAGATPPAIAYIQPRFCNPTGSSLTAAQKHEMLELSASSGMRIIEDDAYAALAFDPNDPDTRLPMVANGPFENDEYVGDVIYIGTVSKLIAPALRTGWVVANRATIARLSAAKEGMDLCGSALNQHIVHRLFRDVICESYIEGLRQVYRERCEKLTAALRLELPAFVQFEKPGGGIFLWLRFPPGWDTGELLEYAANAGTVFYPGRGFYASGGAQTYARLNFSSQAAGALEEGAKRLARAIHEYAAARGL
ncbi:MAG: PLP-dependent aminotransferase family protein [Gammaproteobacteria bacterium]